MEEEQRCQEGHRLCANNCGFFGSPGTMNLCSKCYSDLRVKEEHASSAKIAVEKSLHPPPSSPSPSSSDHLQSASSVVSPTAKSATETAMQTGRCTACRKRVGLTGFRCRCGLMFCGSHRYPEKHGCSFDFKVAGREAIARANPVVKAAKLNKI
ncbi:hypothetical protein HPP92_025797 [Vanilla planifolia]|nr:hypothetical protein HPP92_025797 [Vanilla planifolia]